MFIYGKGAEERGLLSVERWREEGIHVSLDTQSFFLELLLRFFGLQF